MEFAKRFMMATALCVFVVGGSFAQTQRAAAIRPAPSFSQELLANWNEVHHKLVEMAKDFPESKYEFKVQKEQRSFAENLLHIAGVDYIFLNSISTTKLGPSDFGKDLENPTRSVYKTKADVVKLMQQVSDDGAALIKQLGDEGLSKEYKYPYGNRMGHASSSLWSNLEHCGEHYGQLVVYYRANNLVPPESRPRPK